MLKVVLILCIIIYIKRIDTYILYSVRIHLIMFIFGITCCVFKKAIAIHPNFSTTSNRIYVCGGKEVCNIVLESCTALIIIAI